MRLAEGGYPRQQFYEIRLNFQTGAHALMTGCPGRRGRTLTWVAAAIEATIPEHSPAASFARGQCAPGTRCCGGIHVCPCEGARGLVAPRPANIPMTIRL